MVTVESAVKKGSLPDGKFVPFLATSESIQNVFARLHSMNGKTSIGSNITIRVYQHDKNWPIYVVAYAYSDGRPTDKQLRELQSIFSSTYFENKD